tara:strand:+ start:3929 stop:4735 length:807 start_codon:yes stop_codon:yes gene_type:complete
MLVSHETPISFLEESREYNDYDYALVHLFETHPEYYSFFKCSLGMGREVLLDNSIFELKTAFDPEKFAKYVEELKPTYYVIPDVLEESLRTIGAFTSFRKNYSKLPGLKIGVVQGSTYQQLVDCYRYMSDYADYIAISFDYSWYQTVGYSKNPGKGIRRANLERMCNGREFLIRKLISDGHWNHNKPHHLLGCSLAKEFKNYKDIKSIRSLDTSNPIVAGIRGRRYYKDIGLLGKPNIMLADLIDHEVTADQVTDIVHNVKEFKNLIS